MTKPAGVSVSGGSTGSPRIGGTLSSLDVAGRLLPVVPAGGSSPVGTANPAGQMARLLQVAPLAHVGRCLHFFTKLWDR